MKSKLAMRSARELIEATQRLTPEQRLDAMLRHSRLMAKVRTLGRNLRQHVPVSRA